MTDDYPVIAPAVEWVSVPVDAIRDAGCVDLGALVVRLREIADVFFEFHEDDEADVLTAAKVLDLLAGTTEAYRGVVTDQQPEGATE